MSEPKADYSIEAAKAAIEQEREERAARCAEELRALLIEHKCRLEPVAIITAAGVRMDLQIIAE